MDEQELPPLTITDNDIQEANQLSLQCPICANPVEKFVREPELQPVICTDCGTLYHKGCWEMGGNKCAGIGCASETYRIYGAPVRPEIVISHRDLRSAPAPNGSSRTKQLKNEQRRQVEEIRRGGLLSRLLRWLLDQIRVG